MVQLVPRVPGPGRPRNIAAISYVGIVYKYSFSHSKIYIPYIKHHQPKYTKLACRIFYIGERRKRNALLWLRRWPAPPTKLHLIILDILFYVSFRLFQSLPSSTSPPTHCWIKTAWKERYFFSFVVAALRLPRAQWDYFLFTLHCC